MMFLGDEEVSFNENFRFYITTRDSCPLYTPEICSKVNIVNFTVKQKGLEEQVLGVLLRIFDQKIENQRIQCIKTKAKCSSVL